MPRGSVQPFDLSERPIDPRGGFLTNNPDPNTDPEDVEIAGLPWGGEQCIGMDGGGVSATTGYAPVDTDDPYYDDHFQS